MTGTGADGAFIDELTGLPGLLPLRQHLERIVGASPVSGSRPALILVDLDHFRWVDQTYGRAVSDRILGVIGSRLKSLVAEGGQAYRSGNDEFTLLLGNTTTFEALDEARRVLKAVSSPLEGVDPTVTASAAVVMLGHRDRADGIMRDADVTMYRAKVEGGDRVDIYNWELDNWAVARKKEVERLAHEVEELRMQIQLLNKTTTIDPETGMPNGLAFDADHQQLHARRSRSSEPYSILLTGIDHVDDSNRALRVPGGSRVINQVGQTIASTIRLSDRAYRLDENQFAVLLQGTDQRQAIAAAERVRSTVEQLELGHPADPAHRVTLTIVALEAGFRHSSTAEVLADVASLFQAARQTVTNQVVWPH
jgi:diguanylate cyclase (GGDEF)-like protein